MILILIVHAVKRPNGGGTVRKHTIKKLNGDSKAAERIAKSDINQNKNAPEDATSANDTSNLSESTIQALQDALHYKPLSQTSHDTSNDVKRINESDVDATQIPEQRTQITAENNQNNNNVCNATNSADDRSLFQGISLKDFEKHHKLMKEANLEKRRLLSSAIEQR